MSDSRVIRHRFRVSDLVVNDRNGNKLHIFPLMDENHSVWSHGRVLGTATAIYDMPNAMPKSEQEAWGWLPEDIEIAPKETRLASLTFIYIQPNNDWTITFRIEPEKVQRVISKIENEKVGWVTFETFSGQTQMINLSQIIRVDIVYD